MTRYLLLLALMAMISLPANAQTAAEQLQRGIFAQDSQGNIDSAIGTYRQLAYSGLTPRDVAAQAQYRLAQALLTKGDIPGATREFERLERDFADYQKLIASLASARHAAPALSNLTLAAAADDFKLLELSTLRFDAGAPVSFQGKVIQVAWMNPRSVMVVDTGTAKYAVQVTSPQQMLQQGLNRTTFAVGQQITVQALLPNPGMRLVSNGAEVVQANLISSSDGKVLFDWSKVPENLRAPVTPQN